MTKRAELEAFPRLRMDYKLKTVNYQIELIYHDEKDSDWYH